MAQHHFFAHMREDIRSARRRDPAARSNAEILVAYSGLHAVWWYRLTHRLWLSRRYFAARVISQFVRFATGVEIHPGATIGRRMFIDHGMGVVIGETAVIGDGCTIYQGVTLGGTSLTKGAKRHPTLGRGVIISAHAQVVGSFTVGDGARVGANAVVLKEVPAGATAVGNPARVILADVDAAREAAAARMGFSAYGLTQGADPVAQAMKGLIDNASGHEHQIALLWQAIETLSSRSRELPVSNCVPQDAQKTEQFDADRLNRLVK